MNEKINEYLDSTTVPDDDAYFGFDNWTGSAFLSTKILWSDLQTALGATGNLGNVDLSKTDLVRYYTFTSTEASNTDLLIFRNGGSLNSLIISGACEVYNNGIFNVTTNLFYGSNIGIDATEGKNSVFGNNSISGLINGQDNIGVGYDAGRYLQDGSTTLTDSNCSIFIGSETKALSANSDNEIVIGCGTTGFGDNTVVIGNGNTVDNYLFGDLTIDGLSGAGGNVSVDTDGKLLLGVATDPFIHVTSFASLPSTGSTSSAYITDDTDYMYIWDDDNSVYKKVGNEDIYNADGTMSINERNVKLLLDTSTAYLDFKNLSGNSILKIDGARTLFLEGLSAPTGDSYFLKIDDAGEVSSVDFSVIAQNGIYDGSGTLTSNTIVDGDSWAYSLTFNDLDSFTVTSESDINISSNASTISVISDDTLSLKSTSGVTNLLSDTSSINITANTGITNSSSFGDINTIATSGGLTFGHTTTAIITDGNISPEGFQYAADYSATFTDRSLVDKAYVDSSSFLPLSGGTMSGDIDWNANHKIYSSGAGSYFNIDATSAGRGLQLHFDDGDVAFNRTNTVYTDSTADKLITLDVAQSQIIIGTPAGNLGTMYFDGITASRTWTLPDATGTIALLSDITGGSETLEQTLALGNTSGSNDISMDSGQKVTFGGTTEYITDEEGELHIFGSQVIIKTSPSGGQTEHIFGDDFYNMSNSTTSNTFQLTPSAGTITLSKGGSSNTGIFDINLVTTSTKTWQMPDESGVVALTSAITETLTFGGGSTGDVASLTVTGGIITARTLVP